jgi:hypothetical protein
MQITRLKKQEWTNQGPKLVNEYQLPRCSKMEGWTDGLAGLGSQQSGSELGSGELRNREDGSLEGFDRTISCTAWLATTTRAHYFASLYNG